jgi:DNA-directed RNA polymerase subunit RPC12/RpoP
MCNEVLAMHDAIKVAELFWSDYDHENKSNFAWKIFLAVIDLTKSSPELAAEQIEECYFTTAELLLKVEYLSNSKADVLDGNRLSKEYNILLKHLEAVEVRLTTIAQKSGFNVIPLITKDKGSGGRGKQSKYRLSYKTIEIEIDRCVNKIPDSEGTLQHDSNDIEYYVESTPKLLIWARWIQHLNVEKYRIPIILFTASPYITGVACIVMFGLMMNGIGLLLGGKFITWSIIYVAFFMGFFRYLITAINNNIALLPDWMLPLKLTSAVLQYELNEPGSDKQRLKKISVKVYAAKCPICGHRVFIKSKGFPFSRRLVGECDLNPIEHRYSFDFTNLKGKKLT